MKVVRSGVSGDRKESISMWMWWVMDIRETGKGKQDSGFGRGATWAQDSDLSETAGNVKNNYYRD